MQVCLKISVTHKQKKRLPTAVAFFII